MYVVLPSENTNTEGTIESEDAVGDHLLHSDLPIHRSIKLINNEVP